jgi:TolA-binding protein
MATLYFGQGRFDEALPLYQQLQQLVDYAMALQVFRQVAQQSPEPHIRAEAPVWIAETYQRRGETAAALTAYRDLASRFPDQSGWALTALCRAGEIYEALQQY